MNLGKTLSALLAGIGLAAALPAFLLASDTPTKPSSDVKAAPPVTVQPEPKMKIRPKIQLGDYVAKPGQTIALVATVEIGSAPKGGLTVHYSIEGYQGIGQATSGRGGKASLSFTVPNNFQEKIWTVKATIAATGDMASSETTGKLTVYKPFSPPPPPTPQYY